MHSNNTSRQFLIVLALLGTLFLLSCADGGNVYNHLQQQEVGKFHKVDYVNQTNDVGNAKQTGVFDNLQENLLSSYCKGEFSSEEQYYAQLETRAFVEQNPSLCEALPKEDLTFTCDNVLITYYSQTRCLELSQLPPQP